MVVAKCHPDMIAYAQHMKCDVCNRRAPPKRVPRATMPYRPTRFNDTAGIDFKYVKDATGETFFLVNILDLAAGFNLGILLKDKSAKAVSEAFKAYWLSWAGPLGRVVADQGKKSFCVFFEFMRQPGIRFKLIALAAPWQNGMVERHGGVLGDIITVIGMETGAVGFDMMKDVCIHRPWPRTAVLGKPDTHPAP